MDTLGPLRKTVHICLMGGGTDHHVSLLKCGPSEEDLDLVAQETARINDMVLFLSKHSFPYVSVIQVWISIVVI